MTGARALAALTVLALVAAIGIVGMLLAGGAADAAFFAMTALPLVVGGGCAWWFRNRGAGRKP